MGKNKGKAYAALDPSASQPPPGNTVNATSISSPDLAPTLAPTDSSISEPSQPFTLASFTKLVSQKEKDRRAKQSEEAKRRVKERKAKMEKKTEKMKKSASENQGTGNMGIVEEPEVESVLDAPESARILRSANNTISLRPASISSTANYPTSKSEGVLSSRARQQLRHAAHGKVRFNVMKKNWRAKKSMTKEEIMLLRKQETARIAGQELERQQSGRDRLAMASPSEHDTDVRSKPGGERDSDDSKKNLAGNSDVHMADEGEELTWVGGSRKLSHADDGINKVESKDQSPMTGVEKFFEY